MTHRYSDGELAQTAEAPEPGASPFGFGRPRNEQPPSAFAQPPMNMQQMREFRTKVTQFLHDEAPALVLQSGTGFSDGGTVIGAQGGSQDPKNPIPPPMVVITPEHYNRIVRLLEHKVPVKLSFNVKAQIRRRRHGRHQRDRGDPGRQEKGRDRHGGRPPRFMAGRHGRDG